MDILENSTTVMSAERTCDEERTLKITLELFMKDDFTKCDGCGEELMRRRDLRDHLELFMKGVISRCDECRKDLRSWEDLRGHLRIIHEGWLQQML